MRAVLMAYGVTTLARLPRRLGRVWEGPMLQSKQSPAPSRMHCKIQAVFGLEGSPHLPSAGGRKVCPFLKSSLDICFLKLC